MKLELTVRGERREVDVEPAADGLIVSLDGTPVPVRLSARAGTRCWCLQVEGRMWPVEIRPDGRTASVTVGAVRVHIEVRRALPTSSRRTAPAAGVDRVDVRTPIAGLVIALPRSEGDVVDDGEAVAVVEAMKMQMEVPAPMRGRIDEIRARPGQEVATGQVLVVIRAEPDASR